MPTEQSLMLAATAWQAESTSCTTMDSDLAVAFADILDKQKAATYSASHAVETLSTLMQQDDDFAWTWHCNIAMPFQDVGGTHQQANEAAAIFMNIAFGVDVRKFEQWKSLAKYWD